MKFNYLVNKPMVEKFVHRLILLALFFLGGAFVCWAAEDNGEAVATPNFVDQHQRIAKPDLSDRQRIRFLTSTDYPPFNFLDAEGRLTGFNVDLARAICEELGILPRCQIEALPFADIVPALKRRDGEAVIAGLAMNATTRAEFAFSQPYFRYPARFVTRRDRPIESPIADHLADKVVGVTNGSAHAAMLGAFFPAAKLQTYPDRFQGLNAMRDGKIDAYFGDGVSLSFWLESEAAADCCVFSGGPFLSDRFLGEGLSVAVRPEDSALADAVDYAIAQLVAKGRMTELMLRYFPISAF
ncbi:transporter substrate-binding domain-containing protein [Jiella pelagia]|uniref:Transporter substrate-binding domain-containing protein n=1 Tax=Jiella pelagia TaxID=2986949 RepID=A0ABY7BWE6_9HYPH|nr:transporter substrate-binding domain-containing protein [Jiella pelagia]WAP67824.1 transporter substrate-binding domain-containing protein [Jiella pelagia]